MLIKKGQKLKIKHSRKGEFIGIATENFDTVKSKWWPIKAQDFVKGMSQDWEPGERIPCRGSFVKNWTLCE